MIATAKEVASNARIIAEYAKKIAQQCSDTRYGHLVSSYLIKAIAMIISFRMKYNLEQSVELIPTLATQLTIISSVKAATPNDISVRTLIYSNVTHYHTRLLYRLM